MDLGVQEMSTVSTVEQGGGGECQLKQGECREWVWV